MPHCRPGGAPRASRVRLAQTGSSYRERANVRPTGWAAARRASEARCSLLAGLQSADEARPPPTEGQRVRVTAPVRFMHVPGHKAGFDAEGAVGTVLRVYDAQNLSPNREIKVRFDEPKKWIGHFEAWELEALSEDE
jgi:hypothetical protein